MSHTIYKFINPPIKLLLKSPLHGLMSNNTLLIEFTGRKTGRALSTPISYHLSDGKAHCFTSKTFGWWRNLVDGKPVHLTVKGRRIQTQPAVETTDHPRMAEALTAFLKAVPRDAPHAGVTLDDNGEPNAEDVQRVIPDMVYLLFPIQQG